MQRRAKIGLVVVSLLLPSCTIYDIEGMALLNPSETIVIGDTLSMVVFDRDGQEPPRSAVVWATSDATVATVDELGLVHGVGPGVARITAVTGDYALTVPIKVWEPARLTSVAAGGDFSCGLTAEGVALCWGANTVGQTGRRFAPSRCEVAPDTFLSCNKSAIPIDSDVRFTDLAAGYQHVCAVTADGAAHCWGLNDSGQLGDGTTTDRWEAMPVEGEHVFRSVGASPRGTCGLTADDRMLCWGENRTGILGGTEPASLPTEVSPGLDFTDFSTSGAHVCGITAGGATWCWGSNQFGQLGVEDIDSTCAIGFPCTSEPVEVVDAPPLVGIATHGSTCGLTAAGEAYCWGLNDRGQLGDGTDLDGWQPRMVAGGHAFGALAVGRGRTCATEAAGGALWCWGNTQSNFGNGPDPDVARPPPNFAVRVTALEPVAAAGGLALTELSIGDVQVCGIAPDNLTWCWGYSAFGALGHGVSDRAYETAPLRVVLFDWNDVSGPTLPSDR